MIDVDDIPAELGVTVRGPLEVPPQGMTSEVAIANDVVVKRCRDSRYVSWLRREREVLEALATVDLAVPRLLGAVDRGDEVWIAITRLPGVILPDVLASADARERDRLAERLGALLARLHRCAIPAALRADRPWLDRMLAAAGDNLPWCDGTPAQLAELHAHRPVAVEETLIHGDLGLDNVLVTNDAMTLIDWPMGGSGDPRFDVALALDDVLGSHVAALHAGYGGVPLDADTRAWFERLWDFF